MALCAGWRKCVAESAADLWSQRSHWRRPVDQRLAVRPPLFRSDRSHLYRRLSCRLVLRSLVVPSTSWDLNDSVCPFSRWWCCHLVVRAAPSIPGNCRWRKRIWSSWFHAATPSVLHTHTHTHSNLFVKPGWAGTRTLRNINPIYDTLIVLKFLRSTPNLSSEASHSTSACSMRRIWGKQTTERNVTIRSNPHFLYIRLNLDLRPLVNRWSRLTHACCCITTSRSPLTHACCCITTSRPSSSPHRQEQE